VEVDEANCVVRAVSELLGDQTETSKKVFGF